MHVQIHSSSRPSCSATTPAIESKAVVRDADKYAKSMRFALMLRFSRGAHPQVFLLDPVNLEWTDAMNLDHVTFGNCEMPHAFGKEDI